ncbi:MAG TPA: hypothetical protein VGJ55_19200 [Pyrinomonadaceae bacterium]
MEPRESLRDVENLRFRFQMNNRLRLECLAAVSKVFREFGEPLKDELLSAMVFALPQELISGNGHAFAPIESGANVSAGSQKLAAPSLQGSGGLPPEEPLPPEGPLPPEEPLPPLAPSLPPESPIKAPALPPEQPVASSPEGYLA